MRGSFERIAVLWILLITTSPASASGQSDRDPGTRGTNWGGVGIGSAYATVGCSGCELLPNGGGQAGGWETTVTAVLGRTVRPRLGVGLEGAGWHRAKQNENGKVQHATEGFALAAVLRYYPIEGVGLSLRGAAGAGMTQRYGTRGDSLRWYDVGPAASVGMGYDLRIARSWAIVPYARATGLLALSLRSNVSHSRRPGWLEMGVTLERHWVSDPATRRP